MLMLLSLKSSKSELITVKSIETISLNNTSRTRHLKGAIVSILTKPKLDFA